MRALIVVSGTGTEIGKTHTTCALLHAAGPGALAVKPIESGVTGDEGADGQALRAASRGTFHVKRPPPYLLRRAVSPHLAAREEGRTISPDLVVRYVAECAADTDVLFVELAGGLFSPLGQDLSNADLVRLLRPSAFVLVAPDRLGVLHDVAATRRAFEAIGAGAISAVALVAPAIPDASTGTNADELAWMGAPPVFSIGRGAPEELGATEAVRRLYAALLPRVT